LLLLCSEFEKRDIPRNKTYTGFLQFQHQDTTRVTQPKRNQMFWDKEKKKRFARKTSL